MKKQKLFVYFAFLLFSFFLKAQPVPVIQPFASGFTRPVKVAHAYDNRFFVAEIGGKVKIVDQGIVLPEPFIDISDRINDPDWGGIFSIAFAPDYQTSGYFYLLYLVKNSPVAQLSRFQRSSTNPNLADPNSETNILTIPYENILAGHKGGDLAFGKDGFLYISTGDNGPGSRGVTGDPANNSQNMEKLFGKILRINVVDSNPADNILNKIFALGLRNPWRFSFDRLSGDLWLGDNGQDGWEEVNFAAFPFSGIPLNFGWSCKEGNSSYTLEHCTEGTVYTSPRHLFEGFNNNGGVNASVTGGYVYRGSKYPSMNGYYFFGDYASGRIGSITPDQTGSFSSGIIYPSIVSFGEDSEGELYVLSFSEGTLGRLTDSSNPLPVQLEYFNAKSEGRNVRLYWETSYEANFSHFEIERSQDTKHFVGIFTVSSSEWNHTYSFTDHSPSSGPSYYRLKMVDNDGSYAHSRMVYVKNDNTEDFSVFPNPSSGKFILSQISPGSKISVYNLSGNLIITEMVAAGTNAEIDLKAFPSGLYQIYIETRGLVRKAKLAKK